MRFYWLIGFLVSAMAGCVFDKTPSPQISAIEAPTGFPPVSFPADNVPTQEKIELGRKLFFDPILSLDSTIACASCHFPENAFSDVKALSIGVNNGVGFRNAPPLFNLTYQPDFFRDGGIPTLELQILSPLDNPDEMHLPFQEAVERLARHPLYPNLFRKAFDRGVDGFGLVRAIASFERSLLSGNSAYDRFLQGDKSALSDDAKAGLELFQSAELKCSTCHSGIHFTDFSFANTGLKTDYSDDFGRARITLDSSDIGKFRVPSLRNVEVTAPYMHDGSLATLEAVIDHFASGGNNDPNKHPAISGFAITSTEKSQLITFLGSLTDHKFLENPDHQNPFK